ANAPRLAHGERVAQGALLDARGHALGGLVDDGRRTPEQTGVRGVEIEALEKGAEARVDVVEGADVPEVIEALLAEAAPEALHLAVDRGVVGARMKQGDAEPAARRAEGVAAIRRAVIQVEGVGFPVSAYRADEHAEHVVLALGGVSLEGDEVAGVIVEQAVNADRRALAAEGEGRSVTDVPLPERVGERGLPAQARLGAASVAESDPIESLLAQQLADGAGGDLALLDASVGFEGAQDEWDGGVGMLASDVAKEHAELGPQIAATAAIRAPLRAQAVHAAGAEGVVPTLEGGHRVAARIVGVGRAMPLLSEHAERRGELAVGQIAREQDTDERVPEVSHGFAVVPWEETRHVQNATFPHLS